MRVRVGVGWGAATTTEGSFRLTGHLRHYLKLENRNKGEIKTSMDYDRVSADICSP